MSTWTDTVFHRNHRLANIPMPDIINLPSDISQIVTVTPNTIVTTDVAISCLSTVEGKPSAEDSMY